ncbi:hypothetical protein L9F63_020072 [Diploptera punctata]|uniref:Uncharacterized protein n=1 Tax=Diploptera punctata TaxID=6984 RepID=A0AAD7ZTB7_DIPPU|nr:hypothetical protein L9F63_020072 [Diploptera punctata]
MDFLGLTQKGYVDPIRQMMREDYKEPGLEVKIKPPQRMRNLVVLDVYTYQVDGFARGSNDLLRRLRIKHMRKPVGPLEMYRVPGCVSMEAGWWLVDDGKVNWHKPHARFPIRWSESSRFVASVGLMKAY